MIHARTTHVNPNHTTPQTRLPSSHLCVSSRPVTGLMPSWPWICWFRVSRVNMTERNKDILTHIFSGFGMFISTKKKGNEPITTRYHGGGPPIYPPASAIYRPPLPLHGRSTGSKSFPSSGWNWEVARVKHRPSGAVQILDAFRYLDAVEPVAPAPRTGESWLRRSEQRPKLP